MKSAVLKRLAGILLVVAPWCCVLAQEAPQESPSNPDAAPTISLLTFGPGALYWERFGHDAILIRSGGRALAYNYGIFDFQQKNFFLNFARGYMTYSIAADPLEYDLDLYRYEHRWVVEQPLALTPAQAVKLRDFLEWNAQPEHAEYRYDYFLSNCSTRVRDALDMATGGALRRAMQGTMTSVSYRFEAVRLIAPDRAFALAMDAALGPTADRPIDLWQQSFVPMALMQALRSVRIKDDAGVEVPLVAGETQLLSGTVAAPPAQPPDDRLCFLIAGLALAILLLGSTFARQRLPGRIGFAVPATLLALFCGIGGVILTALWTLTQHWAGWRNANLLLFDPLDLLLIPATLAALRQAWRPSAFARGVAAVVAVAAIATPALYVFAHYQQNLQWIALLLPPQLALAIVLLRQRNRGP